MSFLKDFFANVGTIGLAVSLLLSLASCFLGYKLMKLWIAVAGFSLGFVLGDVVCALLHVEHFGIFFLIGTVVGAGVGFLAFKFFKVGIFLLGGLLGSSATALIVSGGHTDLRILIIIGVGLLVGLVAMSAVKPVVVIFSGLSGGSAAATSAGALFGLAQMTPNAHTILLVGGIVLAVAGIVVQFITNKKVPEPKEQV